MTTIKQSLLLCLIGSRIMQASCSTRSAFWADESGFLVSSELILIATLLVIGLIVGLSEVQNGVTQELNDVGDAIGRLNQSYFYSGFAAAKTNGGGWGTGLKSFTAGSTFVDFRDVCDGNQCMISCQPPLPEIPKSSGTACGMLP